MIGRKKQKKGLRDELTSILAGALTSATSSNGSATPEPKQKGKGALSGVRTVAAGAALYATGRAVVKARDKFTGSSEPEDEEDVELEEDEELDEDEELEEDEDEDEDVEAERNGRSSRRRVRTRVP